jgi:non-ribosomal peptide synthetase component E (peptide arylation enzyme)
MTTRKTHRELIKGWYPYSEEECKEYTARGYWKNLVVTDLLKQNARNLPDKLAFADGDTEVTWAEVLQRATRLGIHLNRLGVDYGDFFVLDTMNTVHAIDLVLGLNMIGAIPVMCLPRHRKREISHHVELHEAKGIAVPVGQKFDYVAMVEEFKDDYPYLKIFLTAGNDAPEGWTSVKELLDWEIEKEYPSDFLDQFRPDPDDICAEHLSGGTTGVPKGIPRTYNDQICQWDYNGRVLGMTDNSVPMVGLPVLHNAGMVALYGPAILRGATTIISQSPNVINVFKLIEKYKITHIVMIPIQMTYWIEAKEKRETYDLSSLRILSGAAEKVRPELAKWFIKEHGVRFVNVFGMSEGPCILTRWDDSDEVAINTIGEPIIKDVDAKFKLVDDQNNEVPQGEIGEMVSKGPLTFKGYYKAEEENKSSFDEDGFFHSGDLMRMRKDGTYVVEGRKKDMIKRAGENVYPPIIEDMIVKFDKVAYCAVVGMPDMKLGEKLCAFVQPKKGEALEFGDIIDHLKKLGVAVFEFPERIEFVDGWPLSPINKIDKRMLRAYITVKAYQEDEIAKDTAEQYLKRDKFTVEDIAEGKVKIEFSGTPS